MKTQLVNAFTEKEKKAYMIFSFILIGISFLFLILSISKNHTNFWLLMVFVLFFSMSCLIQILYIVFFLVSNKKINNKVVLLFNEKKFNDSYEYLKKISLKKHFENNRELILYFTGYSLLALKRENEAITYFEAININKYNVFTAEIVSSTLLIKYLISFFRNSDETVKLYEIYINNEKKLMKLTKNKNRKISLCFTYFSNNDLNNAVIILKSFKISNLSIFEQLIKKIEKIS